MEERNCYVYEDYRIDNWSCCYVGMGSKNEEKRYNRLEVAERNDHHDNIMNSCGIVRTIIRDNLTREEANALEEARIYYYVFALGYTIDIKGYIKGKKSDSHLTNQTWGGDGTKGRNPYANKTEEELEEWKKKKSESMKGKYTGEKHSMYGKHHTEETRKKISEANKGKYTGEKHSMYGKHHTEETRKKISEAMKEIWNNKTEEEKEEWKKKKSEVRKGEKNPMYGRTGEKNPMYGKPAPNRKKVKCHTGEVFTTVKEAGEWCGSHRSNIAKQIQGKKNSAGKHPITGEKLHWEYVD